MNAQKLPSIRVGQGVDVHPLVDGRPLVLGGVTVPFHRGLGGHSDGDVVTHAIADALLGAAGLGDLGGHFPSTDPRWAGVDSTYLLRYVTDLVAEAGWVTGNVDATVCCDRPRLADHVEKMTTRLSEVLGVAPQQLRIVAKSTDRIGFTGRGEGIAATAVCLLTTG